MISAIVTIGDELLIGQVIDTNSSWIAQQLNFIGIKVEERVSVADDVAAIRSTLDRLLQKVDYIFITGGLGPTKDDITKHTLTAYFDDVLVNHQPSLDNIERMFKAYGRTVNPVNVQQAMLPSKARIVVNKNGTAAGMWFQQNGKSVISMPGVPYEMKGMMSDEILPSIQQENNITIYHKTICTQGIGESWLAEKIEDIENELPSYIKLAYLPAPAQVRLRLSAYGAAKESELNAFLNKIVERVGDYVYGFDTDTLPVVLGRILKEKGKTLAVAESCTGGYISHLITSVAGSSAYFKGAVVAYANEIKVNQLGVENSVLQSEGAVSKAVVEQMALGALKNLNSDFAIATSGIAGPGGGSAEKPVGLVWIAVASKDGMFSKEFKFGDNRERTILMASLTAMNLLRKEFLIK
jgi:nicotinamide-nucleotide amidase